MDQSTLALNEAMDEHKKAIRRRTAYNMRLLKQLVQAYPSKSNKSVIKFSPNLSLLLHAWQDVQHGEAAVDSLSKGDDCFGVGRR